MDTFNNNKYKPSLRIKIISMGNAEVGKVSCNLYNILNI